MEGKKSQLKVKGFHWLAVTFLIHQWQFRVRKLRLLAIPIKLLKSKLLSAHKLLLIKTPQILTQVLFSITITSYFLIFIIITDIIVSVNNFTTQFSGYSYMKKEESPLIHNLSIHSASPMQKTDIIIEGKNFGDDRSKVNCFLDLPDKKGAYK